MSLPKPNARTTKPNIRPGCITITDIQALETTLARQYLKDQGPILDEHDLSLVTVASLSRALGTSRGLCRKHLYEQETVGKLERVRVRKSAGGAVAFGWRLLRNTSK